LIQGQIDSKKGASRRPFLLDEPMDAIIATERLILRRMTLADAPDLFALMSDSETMQYWSTLPHAKLEETQGFIRETQAAVADGSADDFLITGNGNGAVMGKVGLWRGCELGILLGRAYWGQGFAQEALRAVVARGFARGHPAIVADVDPRNAGSLKLLGRLGFRKTGEAKATYLIGQDWTDSVYLSLSAADYGT
jgi:ribosomal-protein-alanine N-acetyltransferase